MEHYKAIITIHNRIVELRNEIKKLENTDPALDGFSGYVFIQKDIKNLSSEILQLTETMQFLVKLTKNKTIQA